MSSHTLTSSHSDTLYIGRSKSKDKLDGHIDPYPYQNSTLPARNSSSPFTDTDVPLHSSPQQSSIQLSPTTSTRPIQSNGTDTPPDPIHTHTHNHSHNRTRQEDRQATIRQATLRPRQPTARVTLTSYAPTDQSFYFEPITFDLIEHDPPMILCRANQHTTRAAFASGNKISFASRVVTRDNHAQIYFDHERVGLSLSFPY